MKDGLSIEKFKGEHFSSWKMRFKSKMNLLNGNYEELLELWEKLKAK